MFKAIYPDEYLDSTYEIDFEQLYEDGYRGVIFDIDNTLVEHGAPTTEAAIALVDKSRRMGFSICFVSNPPPCIIKPEITRWKMSPS